MPTDPIFPDGYPDRFVLGGTEYFFEGESRWMRKFISVSPIPMNRSLVVSRFHDGSVGQHNYASLFTTLSPPELEKLLFSASSVKETSLPEELRVVRRDYLERQRRETERVQNDKPQ